MLSNSTINLSHDDLESAVAYWLNGRVFSYDIRNTLKVTLKSENGVYLVSLSPIQPQEDTSKNP